MRTVNFFKKPISKIFLVSSLALVLSSCSTLSPGTIQETENNTNNQSSSSPENNTNSEVFNINDYTMIDQVDCTTSGSREPNAVMDIGFGDREYYGFTNENSQLVYVEAKEIILQDDDTEDVNSNGRYCSSLANVPGVESSDLDRGHVIADSLGGTSSAYNITPQESRLNRHGDQAYMEDSIRNAGGATDFQAWITYPNDETHIPSNYEYKYTIQGNEVHDSFPNIDPEQINEELGIYEEETPQENTPLPASEIPVDDISSIDTNGNGKVTISEAEKAGFTMPITSDHWLYKYMTDGNNDGIIG